MLTAFGIHETHFVNHKTIIKDYRLKIINVENKNLKLFILNKYI